MRCILYKTMFEKANVFFLDEPKNSLNLKPIISLNNSLISLKVKKLLTSIYHILIKTVCYRIIEIDTMNIIRKNII